MMKPPSFDQSSVMSSSHNNGALSAERGIVDSSRDDCEIDGRSLFHADLLADAIRLTEPLNWVLEGYIENNSLALLVGPSGHYKTFLAIDWAMSIASGTPWMGCRVTERPVIYIAGEGRTGVVRRMRGWLVFHERPPPPVYISKQSTELCSSAAVSEIRRFVEQEGHSEPLIIVDTLARNFGSGNENSTADMSNAVSTLDILLRDTPNATVLIVHHVPLANATNSGIRSRGSSALPAAADTIVNCDNFRKSIRVHCDKQKDGDPPADKFLRPENVALNLTDNFGKPVSTCVLVESESGQDEPPTNLVRGKHQVRVVEALRLRAENCGSLSLTLSPEELGQVMEEAVPDRKRRYEVRKWLFHQSWVKNGPEGHEVNLIGMSGD